MAPETDPTPLIELAPSSNQLSADPPVLANTHEENSSSTMTMTVADEDDAAARTKSVDHCIPTLDGMIDFLVHRWISLIQW